MGQINIGLAKIEVGPVGADGGMGTALAPLGKTLEGTAKINMDEPNETEFKVEESEQPIYVKTTAGKTSIAFTVADPDEDTLVKAFGGVKTGTGAATTWDLPITAQNIEQSIKITPEKGLGFNIPRASIKAKFTSDIGRANLLGVEVTGTVLLPTKAGTSAISTFRV